MGLFSGEDFNLENFVTTPFKAAYTGAKFMGDMVTRPSEAFGNMQDDHTDQLAGLGFNRDHTLVKNSDAVAATVIASIFTGGAAGGAVAGGAGAGAGGAAAGTAGATAGATAGTAGTVGATTAAGTAGATTAGAAAGTTAGTAAGTAGTTAAEVGALDASGNLVVEQGVANSAPVVESIGYVPEGVEAGTNAGKAGAESSNLLDKAMNSKYTKAGTTLLSYDQQQRANGLNSVKRAPMRDPSKGAMAYMQQQQEGYSPYGRGGLLG